MMLGGGLLILTFCNFLREPSLHLSRLSFIAVETPRRICSLFANSGARLDAEKRIS